MANGPLRMTRASRRIPLGKEAAAQQPRRCRPLVLSSWDDEDRIATERALLFGQIADQLTGTNHLHFSRRDYSPRHSVPTNIIRSSLFDGSKMPHQSPHGPAPYRNKVYDVYSSRIFWPFKSKSKINVETDSETEYQHCCQHESKEVGTDMPNVPTWRLDSVDRSGAKDNIMKFANKSTNTPRFGEACCGPCHPLPRGSVSQGSMTTFNTPAAKGIAQMAQTSAPPILKRTRVGCATPCCGEYDYDSPGLESTDPVDTWPEELQSADAESNSSMQQDDGNVKKEKSCHRVHKKSKKGPKISKINCQCPIMDVQGKESASPKETKEPYCKCSQPSKRKVKRHSSRECSSKNSSRASLKYDDDGVIPYSHQRTSKYHLDCRRSPTMSRYDYEMAAKLHKKADEEDDGNCHPSYGACCQPPIKCRIYLPRRVLPSARNIEFLMDRNKPRAKSKSPYRKVKRQCSPCK